MTDILATEIEAWPLAARVRGASGSAANQWQVVIAGQGAQIETSEALFVELESLYDGSIRQVAVHSVEEWMTAISVDRDDLLVLSHESRFACDDWRKLDLARSRLMRAGMTIVIVDSDGADAMVTCAPNLWSWIGGMVWRLRVEDDVDD